MKFLFLLLLSAGKSTLLNALLGDKFSEVSLKRTTACVNFFDVTQTDQEPEAHPPTVQTADIVLQEISKDNQESSPNVKEKNFKVKIEHSICEMREDTKLVLVDIPGFDSTGSSKKYRDYLEQNWTTLDCVVVVIDVFQVDDDEQLDLLKFVEDNRTRKDIPIIVVANKVDDPNDEDTIQQVKEIRQKTTTILNAENKPTSTASKTAFVPLSAKNAFVYMKAGSLDLNHLHDPKYADFVNKIGYNEYGLTWSKAEGRGKVATVFNILQNPSVLDARLAGTNFTSFLSKLSEFVGGNERQEVILANQVKFLLNNVSEETLGEKMISEFILENFKKLQAIGKGDEEIDSLQKTFWRLYRQYETDVFREYLEKYVDPTAMERPHLELEKYHELTLMLGWKHDASLVQVAVKQLLRRQLNFLLEKAQAWSLEAHCVAAGATMQGDADNINIGWHNEIPRKVGHGYRLGGLSVFWKEWKNPETVRWRTMSPQNWIFVLESLSLVWNQTRFIKHFGPDKIKLERTLMNFRCKFELFSCQQVMNPTERLLLFAYKNQIMDKPPATVEQVPISLADPSHWGFSAWKFINFCGREKRKASTLSE